jgi:DNA gyrase subunit A
MMISSQGQIVRTGLEEVRAIGRNTAGVTLIRLKTGDKLVAVERLASEDEGTKDEQAEKKDGEGGNE